MNTKHLYRAFFLMIPGRWQMVLTASVCTVLLVIFGSTVWAFPSYDGCEDCHGGFEDSPYTSLHDSTNWGVHLMEGHWPFVDVRCMACHKPGFRSEVFLNFSGDSTLSKGCVGCHGRDEDVTGNCTGLSDSQGGVEAECGSGAGLRQHHELQVGVGTCSGCHDGDATPVGEHIAPFNYGLSDVVMKDSCDSDGTESQFGATGLDNDGDGQRDGGDSDCQSGGPLFTINAGHAGAWFNPETPGQGQLIDVEPESRFLFLSWFTFTDDTSENPNEQHWFTAQGNYSDDTADLLVYETLGGRFDDPQTVSTDPVGQASLSFTDCGHGQMSYTIDTWDLQGSFPLQRAIPGTENVCEDRAGITAEPLELNDGRDGAWFDAATPGQGFLIDAHPNPAGDDFIFVAWFTYGENTASGQRWLTAQGPLEGSTANIIVYETVGGSFDDPEPSETNAVGTMNIDFTDCSNALLSYSITDEALAGMIDIERAIPGTQALCIELAEQNQ